MNDPRTHAEAKLDALSKRMAQTRVAMRTEKDRIRVTEQKDQDRRVRIVGRAVLAAATRSSDVQSMLRSVLQNTPLSDTDRKFLERRNWL